MIRHILVVDDDIRVVESFARNLALWGYRVSTAPDGATALARFAADPPDLALVDVRMPGLDGLEVLRTIRARDPEAEVILVTGHGDMELAIAALRAGASDFVPKPVDKITLEATLQRAEARLRLKRRLAAEQARFLWVVEQAEVGYVIIDANEHILYANPQARKLLEWPADLTAPATVTLRELAAAHYVLQPPAAWADWPTVAPAPAEGGLYLVRPSTATVEARWLRVDRAVMTAEESLRYLVRIKDVSGEIAGRSFVWTFERMIGHKLKDPLGQLTGFLQVLEADWPTLAPETLAADLAAARQGAEVLQARIMDIFQYLEAPGFGRGQYPLAELPDLLARIKTTMPLEQLTLTADSTWPPSATLPLNPQAVELILWELCDNARKFHPDQQPAVTVAVQVTAEGSRLTVTDDGRHLPPDVLEQLGTPYYQAESPFTAETPGMGLGLATITALVWNVGGTCRFENRPDRPGLVVELWFPS